MPTRAQRRRNRDLRAAIAEEEAYAARFPVIAEEELGTRREFIAEAIRSKGLVSLTFRPRGESNYIDVYGGTITTDGSTKLRGDGIVNDWAPPEIRGYRVRYDASSALICRLEPNITSIDVSDIWLRTSEELLMPHISTNEAGPEENITTTREGLVQLTRTLGHGAIAQSLSYIDEHLFETPK